MSVQQWVLSLGAAGLNPAEPVPNRGETAETSAEAAERFAGLARKFSRAPPQFREAAEKPARAAPTFFPAAEEFRLTAPQLFLGNSGLFFCGAKLMGVSEEVIGTSETGLKEKMKEFLRRARMAMGSPGFSLVSVEQIPDRRASRMPEPLRQILFRPCPRTKRASQGGANLAAPRQFRKGSGENAWQTEPDPLRAICSNPSALEITLRGHGKTEMHGWEPFRRFVA